MGKRLFGGQNMKEKSKLWIFKNLVKKSNTQFLNKTFIFNFKSLQNSF